jgi:hypothetical protein
MAFPFLDSLQNIERTGRRANVKSLKRRTVVVVVVVVAVMAE